MMMSEFMERTGFTPTYDEYLKIEDDYYHFDGDKDEFCKYFVKTNGALKIADERVQTIEQLRKQMVELKKTFMRNSENDKRQIEKLTAELDKELEWKPADNTGTNMSQERYEHLLRSGKAMTDDEAKQFISEECGFMVKKINIVHEVSTYEVNKYYRLRKAATHTRKPVYEATDWNYVRFNCCGFMYEIENGEIRPYCS